MNIEQAFASQFDNYYRKKQFNGVVAIAENDTIVYQQAWGVANLDERPLETSDIFNLASVSKQFTALCIRLLCEDGALDYDDAISDYISELEDTPYSPITIRNLLQHTSGLPDYMELLEEHWDEEEIVNNDDIIQLFSEHQPALLFKPQKKYDYSNTGYAFLASIVERASEQSFEDFLQARIFKPLKMKHSFGYRLSKDGKSQAPYEIAIGFERDAEDSDEYTENHSSYLDGVIGDGNIFSNIEDLVKYHAALFTEKLVSTETLEEAYTPTELSSGKTSYYGFGWDLFEGGTFVSHTGSWLGFNTYFLRDLESQQAYIILDNSTNENLHGQVDKIIDKYYS
jgi:CubicO group peptidase (beta-lactamase class C family)